jgi:hypothetical protein
MQPMGPSFAAGWETAPPDGVEHRRLPTPSGTVKLQSSSSILSSLIGDDKFF